MMARRELARLVTRGRPTLQELTRQRERMRKNSDHRRNTSSFKRCNEIFVFSLGAAGMLMSDQSPMHSPSLGQRKRLGSKLRYR